MSKKFLMGNEAIAWGAIHAGVQVVSGYPGTPSTEILETVAKLNDEHSIYVEWSVNEKAALEVAAGAAWAGARTMVTMKQVGLNVASDPLMSLAYVGVEGGMVIAVADDPGPISSQTEQDTRLFARFAKLPVFDPSSPEEAYAMVQAAFELSERYHTPVLLRPTTRVCHGCASVEVTDAPAPRRAAPGFVRDTKRWVIFPRTSYENHIKLEKRERELGRELSASPFNRTFGEGKLGVVSSGISHAYVQQALLDAGAPPVRQLKIGTAYPFPEELALTFLREVEQVLVVEELDPVVERELTYLCGRYGLPVSIRGKLTGDIQPAGENTVESVAAALARFLGLPQPPERELPQPPALPVRPPVLCAGCPHRAAFYAVKRACRGIKAVFCGDIGCYTLGNAAPLDMVDTCLCMGADVTMAQGMYRAEPDAVHFSFIGDSTFFASGIPGVVNAVYNQAQMILVVLDNSTTAMTGHQPHPGTGRTMMGGQTAPLSIEQVLAGVGVGWVRTVDPLRLDEAEAAVRAAMETPGVKAIIFRSPCIAVSRPGIPWRVDAQKCVGCLRCVRELGCPAIAASGKEVTIEPSLCFGCGLCGQVCPTGALERGSEHEEQ